MKEVEKTIHLFADAECPHCKVDCPQMPVLAIRGLKALVVCVNCKEQFIGNHDG